MTAPSRIDRERHADEHYESEEAYLKALARPMRVEYEAIIHHGFPAADRRTGSALERHVTYQDRPLGDFLSFVELGCAP